MLHNQHQNEHKPAGKILKINGVAISVPEGLKMPSHKQTVSKDYMHVLCIEDYSEVFTWPMIEKPSPDKLQAYANKVFAWMKETGKFEQQARAVSSLSSSPSEQVVPSLGHNDDKEVIANQLENNDTLKRAEARRAAAKARADARAAKVAQARAAAEQSSSSSKQMLASLGYSGDNEVKASESNQPGAAIASAYVSIRGFQQHSQISQDHVTFENTQPGDILEQLVTPRITEVGGQKNYNMGIACFDFSIPGEEERYNQEMPALLKAIKSADNHSAAPSPGMTKR